MTNAVPATGAPFAPPVVTAFAAPAAPVRPRRPSVLDAERTAAIPLRPLTMIEVLDAGFLVLRRRPQAMLGLPALVALALVLQGLATVWGTWLLGEQRGQVAQVLFALLGWMAITVVAVVAVMWVNAVLTRVSLEVLLGPGFAPAPLRLDAGTVFRATPGILLLGLLEIAASWVVQSALGVVSYAFTPFLVFGDATLAWVGSLLMVTTLLLVTCWAYSYLGLAVPAYMVENARTPGWIGKPYRTTNAATAFTRAFQLIGMRNAHRAALVLAGAVLVCLVVSYLSAQGFVALLVSLLQTFDRAMVEALVAAPMVVIGILVAGQLVGLAVAVAFLSAVQTTFYLDLRMRREGLDLALRFDHVAVPQPVAPPAPRMVPIRWHQPPPFPPGQPQVPPPPYRPGAP